MAYIPGISQAYTAQAQGKSTESERSTTLGQEDFLTLLVAQLQNQDPLNPSDPTEFTAQLAQFSELEQLFNLNDSMESLAQAQNNSERLSALSLIGKEVLVEGAEFHLGTGGADIGYRVDGDASDIRLSIQDSRGVTVATLPATDVSSGNHLIHWDGTNTAGEQLPEGNYNIVIQAQSAAEGATVAVAPLVRTMVTGVDLSGAEAILVTESGEFTISSIHGAYNEDAEAAAADSSGEEEAVVSDIIEEAVSEAMDGEGVAEESDAQAASDAATETAG